MTTSDPTTTETVADIVKDESARQLVILLFGITGTIISAYIVQVARDPDKWHLIKMEFCLWLKRYARKRADWWQKVSDNAATSFNYLKD